MINVYTYTKWLNGLYYEELGRRDIKVFLYSDNYFVRIYGKDSAGAIACKYHTQSSLRRWYGNSFNKVNKYLDDGNHVIIFNKETFIYPCMVWHEVGHLITYTRHMDRVKAEFLADRWVINEAKKRGFLKIIRELKWYNDKLLKYDISKKSYECQVEYRAILKVDKLFKKLKLEGADI